MNDCIAFSPRWVRIFPFFFFWFSIGGLHAQEARGQVVTAQQVIVYPMPGGISHSEDFTVRVRNPGQSWRVLPVYLAKVVQVVDTKRAFRQSSMAYFDFSGTVEVSVTYHQGAIRSAGIRPLSYGVQPVVTGNTITFSLSRPLNLSVEVNGDIFHNLQLFANPLETDRPSSMDSSVIYFGPGVHNIGLLNVPSNKTVYIAGGAVVQGQLLIRHAENVKVRGRGIMTQVSADSVPDDVQHTRSNGLTVEYSRNVEMSGLILMPHKYSILVGQSAGITIRGIKSLSAEGNADGIDVFCSSDVLIEDIFMRNSDDCIAIYGHRWNYYGNTKNVIVRGAVLWADLAHPILAGTHGDSKSPDTLEGLHFANIDILDQHESQMDYQGCMSLNAGDDNLIRDVTFDHIRVEDFREGQLVNLRVMYNKKYNMSPGRRIENVLFKDVSYHGNSANLSVIAGYDDSRSVRNIVFENLVINGRLISDTMPGKPGYYKTSDMARFFVGEHVENIRFY